MVDLTASSSAVLAPLDHLISEAMLPRLAPVAPSRLQKYYRLGQIRHYLDLLKLNVENFDSIIDSSQPDFGADSLLPFNRNRSNETFGKVIRSENSSIVKSRANRTNNSLSDIIDTNHVNFSAGDDYPNLRSAFRNADGSFIRGRNAQEARLDPRTVEASVDLSVIRLPRVLAQTINQNILARIAPRILRQRALEIFSNLQKNQIQKAPVLSLDADAHIAALFLQNYSHSTRVLKELKKRVGSDFNPSAVLDVGYGPGSGMLALNELMGPNFSPKVKDVYVVGRRNKEMKKRAKILLSRQLCEIPENNVQSKRTGTENEDPDESYVGDVDTSKINIRTKIRDALPSTKTYDLIMVNQSLLTREYNFPRDIDINLEMILRLLLPGGHLVLIERGNALGFEIIARARQVMLRPESHLSEHGRIPRPYIRGSSVKPQKLRQEDQIITEDYIEYENKLLAELNKEEIDELVSLDEKAREAAVQEMEKRGEIDKLAALRQAIQEIVELERKEQEQTTTVENDLDEEEDNLLDEVADGDMSAFEAEIIAKHGEVSEEDLKFEFEDDPDYEVLPVDEFGSNEFAVSLNEEQKVDYHLSVIAPCPHHGQCPLQLGDLQFYSLPSQKHRFNFCSFDQIVERPKYSMELKKGKLLATSWNKRAHDGFGFDRMSKSKLRDLEGSGRPRSGNTESGSFSYLIVKREKNDPVTIGNIEARRNSKYYSQNLDENLPRVIEYPVKVKSNVSMKMCAPSGNVEIWQIPRSLGHQVYHDARKAQQGDLWALGKKSARVKSRFSQEKLKELRSKLAYKIRMKKNKRVKEKQHDLQA